MERSQFVHAGAAVVASFLLPQTDKARLPGHCYVERSDLVIFEAARPGAVVDERLDVRMAPGAYCVLTAYWQPDSKTSFRLDKLAPVS